MLTVREKGIIGQANLTGAAHLGIDRQSLIGKPLTRFITQGRPGYCFLHCLQILKKLKVITPVKL